MDFNNYHVHKLYQEYNSRTLGKIDKWAKKMDVQMRPTVLNPLNPIFVVSFLDNFKIAWGNNRIHGGPVIWLLTYLNGKLVKAVLLHQVIDDNR